MSKKEANKTKKEVKPKKEKKRNRKEFWSKIWKGVILLFKGLWKFVISTKYS